MAERKVVNKYYPPDWDPSKHGSINSYRGQHPLRERAKKLKSEGILVIRFEMPFNIWCDGCSRHIAKGVRFNAEKKKIGMYFTTTIYSFSMKCPSCSNVIVVHTDPSITDYVVYSGGRRKTESFDPDDAEVLKLMDEEERKRVHDDPISKMEYDNEKEDLKKKDKARIDDIYRLVDSQSDNYSISQVLRKKFREQKKILRAKNESAKGIECRNALNLQILRDENPEDIERARLIMSKKRHDPSSPTSRMRDKLLGTHDGFRRSLRN